MKLDWDDVLDAFEQYSETIRCYLDRRTGRVVQVNKEDPDASDIDSEEAEAHPERYVRIHPAGPEEERAWMREFVETVEEASARDALRAALDGPDGLRGFRDALADRPNDRERWFAYREEKINTRIEHWLEAWDIAPLNPPPWQEE